MSFSDILQENIRKGVVWVAVGAFTAGATTLIATSRDDAVHTQEIRQIRVGQRTLANAVAALNVTATQLSIQVARLNQEMADAQAARLRGEKK